MKRYISRRGIKMANKRLPEYEHVTPKSAPAITLEGLQKIEKLCEGNTKKLLSSTTIRVFLAIAEGANDLNKINKTVNTDRTNLYGIVGRLEQLGLVIDMFSHYEITRDGNSILEYTDPDC